MLGHRDLSMEDYVAMLRRHVWLIAVPVLLGPIVGLGLSLVLPPQYVSSTLVLIEEQNIPEKIVPPLVSDTPAERLVTLKERILSRTKLEPVIQNNQLFSAHPGSEPMEEIVAKVRKNITVTPVQSTVAKAGVQGFQVSFSYSDPHVAKAVAGEITSMFVDESLRQQDKRISDTVNFLRAQLDDAKKKLDEQDARLATFKTRNTGQLPGDEESNWKRLAAQGSQLDATTTALNRALQDKAYLESQLALAVGASAATLGGANPSTLELQLGILQDRLSEMRAQYTEQHPDIRKLKADIEQLKQRIAAANAAAKTPVDKTHAAAAIPSQQVQQLQNQIRLLDQTVQEKTRDQQRLQRDIEKLQASVQSSPTIEEEHKKITRDYGIALTFYNDLLGKLTSAELFQAMSIRQQGERFQLIDAANLPASPAFPNRPLFAAGGLGAGLALGLGVALLLEMKDKSIRGERDVEFYLEMPALALLPSLGDQKEGRKSFWGRKLKTEEKETIEV